MKDGSPPPEPTREQLILQAALIEFAENSYAGASIQHIATRAGVAKSLIFHHFTSKKNLYLTVLQKTYDDLVEAVQPSLTEETSFMQAIIGSGNAKLRYFLNNPYSYRMIYSALQQTEPEISEGIRRIYQEQMQNAEIIMAKSAKTLPLRQGLDAGEVIHLIMAVLERVQQVIMTNFSNNPENALIHNEDMWQVFMHYLEMIFYGILREPLPEIERELEDILHPQMQSQNH